MVYDGNFILSPVATWYSFRCLVLLLMTRVSATSICHCFITWLVHQGVYREIPDLATIKHSEWESSNCPILTHFTHFSRNFHFSCIFSRKNILFCHIFSAKHTLSSLNVISLQPFDIFFFSSWDVNPHWFKCPFPINHDCLTSTNTPWLTYQKPFRCSATV